MKTRERNVPNTIEDKKEKSYLLQKEVLSFEEARIYLDNISSSYLYKLTSARKIPHYCPTGKLIYFKRSELEEWVFSNRRKTTDEMNTEAETYLKKPKGN
ncbi:MAG: DNA-binding protein [Chitinophagaceae bacterium]|nr:MAG: DNA-binding protein [Chitinophagaceae bacterium]